METVETREDGLTFADFLKGVDEDMQKHGHEGSYTGMTGHECWLEAYRDGDTPQEAAAEDRTYWGDY